MKLSIALAVPMFLILVGVLLLIGCLPIPATQQLQPNLKPKPEVAIGTTSDKAIQLGHTRIDDAFIEISRRIQVADSTHYSDYSYSGLDRPWIDLPKAIQRQPSEMLDHWRVSDDGRQFTARYAVRTMTFIWPTCATAQTESRYIVLTVDPNGVVMKQKTLTDKDKPDFSPLRQSTDRWLEVFDEPTRRKLQAAGVFPTDKQIEGLQSYEYPLRDRILRPTTQENHP